MSKIIEFVQNNINEEDEMKVSGIREYYWDMCKKYNLWNGSKEEKYRRWLQFKLHNLFSRELISKINDVADKLTLSAYRICQKVVYPDSHSSSLANSPPYIEIYFEENLNVLHHTGKDSSYFIERGIVNTLLLDLSDNRQYYYFPSMIKTILTKMPTLQRAVQINLWTLYPEQGDVIVHPSHQIWELQPQSRMKPHIDTLFDETGYNWEDYQRSNIYSFQ